jgi:hypothetical protein
VNCYLLRASEFSLEQLAGETATTELVNPGE